MVLNSLSFLSRIEGTYCKVTESHTRFLELLLQYNADFTTVAHIYNTTTEKAQSYFSHLKDYVQHVSGRMDIHSLNDPLLNRLIEMITQIDLYDRQPRQHQPSSSTSTSTTTTTHPSQEHRTRYFSREYLYEVSSLLCECLKHEMELDEIINFLYINYNIPTEVVNKAITYFESRNPDFFQRYHTILQAKQQQCIHSNNNHYNNNNNNATMDSSETDYPNSSLFPFVYPHTRTMTTTPHTTITTPTNPSFQSAALF